MPEDLSPLHTHAAKRIRAMLVKKKWTQYLLADRAGIGRAHLSRLLNLQQSPSLRTLEKIAAALEIPTRDLLPPTG